VDLQLACQTGLSQSNDDASHANMSEVQPFFAANILARRLNLANGFHLEGALGRFRLIPRRIPHILPGHAKPAAHSL
jgi:hypothetical protein